MFAFIMKGSKKPIFVLLIFGTAFSHGSNFPVCLFIFWCLEVTQTSNEINSHDVSKTKNSRREGLSLTNEKVVFAYTGAVSALVFVITFFFYFIHDPTNLWL